MTSALLAISKRCGKTIPTVTKPFITRLWSENYKQLVPHPAVQNSRCLHGIQPSNSKLYIRFNDMIASRPRLMHNLSALQFYQQPMKVFPICQRLLHKESGQYPSKRRPVPKLLYIQNPMTWLANKFDFRMLRRAWDHEFDEWEFRKGSKQAVSMITNMVAENCFKNLRGLLTSSALTKLQRDVETTWTDQQRRNIGLTPEDIQLAVPRRVHFQRIVEQRFCDIDMVFIGLKWADTGTTSVVVFIEIIARFHREYTEGRLPDWTISLFKVTRFNVLPK